MYLASRILEFREFRTENWVVESKLLGLWKSIWALFFYKETLNVFKKRKRKFHSFSSCLTQTPLSLIVSLSLYCAPQLSSSSSLDFSPAASLSLSVNSLPPVRRDPALPTAQIPCCTFVRRKPRRVDLPPVFSLDSRRRRRVAPPWLPFCGSRQVSAVWVSY